MKWGDEYDRLISSKRRWEMTLEEKELKREEIRQRKDSNGRRILPLIDSTSAVSPPAGFGKGSTHR